MSKLVVSAIGPACSVQDHGRDGYQRYGLVASGAMDRLALAAANTLLGNDELFAAAVEVGPFTASFTARDGAVRVALCGAQRSIEIAGHAILNDTSMTIAEGETLNIGFAKGGAFSYLAIEGGIEGEPTFGSLAVNPRAGLGSPFARPLQQGDELAAKPASGAPDQRIELPALSGPIRVVLGPQDDEFDDAAKALFLDSDWKISATSDRMGYRLEGPVIKHLHGHNIVSDGTVDGSIQVPGNGAPIVLMMDRNTTGGYPKIATVISADLGRLAQTPAGTAFRFKAVSMQEAQAETRKFAELLRSLPDRLRGLDATSLNIDALRGANVAGSAVNAVDAGTWQAERLAQD